MKEWQWCFAYEEEARASGDAERLRMARLHYEGWGFRETDPERAYALYQEGGRLARRLGEPWWELFYAHWQLEALLFFQRDYRDVLRPAVTAVLEGRKPQYEGFPFRFSLYYDLVSAYLGIDPAGYAVEVRDALVYLEEEAPNVSNGHCLLEDCRNDLAMALDDLDGAEQSILRWLRHADVLTDENGGGHFKVYAHCALCLIAFKRGDEARLAEHAAAGEQAARALGYKLQISECQMWQALQARRAGDQAKAQTLRLQATSRVSRLKKPPSVAWFNALCAWALCENDLPAALQVRDLELAIIAGKGRLWYECYCHIERCRLLARMGRPLDEALAAGRAAAARLRKPAPELEKLGRIARGETANET